MAPDEFVEQPDPCLAPLCLQGGVRKVGGKVDVGCSRIRRLGWWRVWNRREEGQDTLIDIYFDGAGRYTVYAEVKLDTT